MQKAHQTLNKTDIAILVVDASSGVTAEDQRILSRIREKQIPCLVAVNKSDLDSAGEIPKLPDSSAIEVLPVSAKTGQGIEKLKERIAALAPKEEENRRIVGDLLSPGDLVCLVIPIDKAAPKGRLILPQQQTIRDILDTGALALAVRDTELKAALEGQDGRPGSIRPWSSPTARPSPVWPP